ncbi:ABC transporter substrate-binding protein [Marinomonas epiphytica]
MLRFFCVFLFSVSVVSSYAQTVTFALDADPISLDPHEQLSEGALQYSHLVFDPLVRWTNDGEFEARLATQWQQLDDKTWRISLREGVKFHSGNPLRSEDVAYTLQRLKRSTDFKALFSILESVVVESDNSLLLVTRSPYPLMLNMLALVFPIDSAFYQGRDEIVKFGRSFASAHASGTGPYVVEVRQPGQKLVFARNPNYWDKASLGNVEHLVWLPIRSDSTRLSALLTQDVDVITSLSPIDVARVKRQPDLQLASLVSSRILMLQLNQKKRPELRDIRVREAINLAINQELIVDKILRGYGLAAGQVSAPQFLGHKAQLKPSYDLKRARQLMKQAGYQEGFELTFIAPNNRYMSDEHIAQAVVGMLDKINIKVALKTLPKAQYFQQLDKRAADIMMLGWQSDTLDSNNIYEFLFACQSGETGRGVYNANGYCNPQLDKAIDAANHELNPALRQTMLQNIEQQIHDDFVVVPLHWQAIIWAASKHVDIDAVLNFQNFPYLGDLVSHIEEE